MTSESELILNRNQRDVYFLYFHTLIIICMHSFTLSHCSGGNLWFSIQPKEL